MYKNKILSILVTINLLWITIFTNFSYAKYEQLSQVETSDILLSKLIYDDDILKYKNNLPKRVKISDYKKFEKQCKEYITGENKTILYQDIKSLEKHISKYELIKVVNNSKTGFKGAVFKEEYKGKKNYTVVFCGTEDIKDWDNNLKEVIMDTLHYQRKDAIKLVKDALEDKPDYIRITGHSLGGFLSQTIGAEILDKKITIPKNTNWVVSTYNAPGIFSPTDIVFNPNKVSQIKEYKDFYNSIKSYLKDNIVMYNHIISGDLVGNYGMHVGTNIRYGSSSTIKPMEYHGLENFHKYGFWDKEQIPVLTINDVKYGNKNIKGKTIANADVRIYVDKKKIAEGKSNSSGSYDIKIPTQSSGKMIEVKVYKSGSFYIKKSIKVKSAIMKKLEVNTIYFDSKSIQGKTEPGASVKAHIGKSQLGKTVVAGKDGKFKIDISNKSVGTLIEITSTKKNYDKSTVAKKVEKKNISSLNVNKIYTESTSINGKTQPGVTVKAYIGKKQIGKTVTSDKNGNYKITSVPKQLSNKKIEIKASKPNYNTKTVSINVIKSSTVKLDANTIYYDSTSISGKTTSGATVKAYVGKKQLGKTIIADKDGNYKISNIPKHSVGTKIEIKASKTNYVSKSVIKQVSNKTISKLTASTVYTDSTSISGQTLSGATVKAYIGSKQIGKTVTSDKNGNYKITSIPKQSLGKKIDIKASKKNYNTKTVYVQVKSKNSSIELLPFIHKGKVGYMDQTGKIIIKPKFYYVENLMDDTKEAAEFIESRAKVYTSSQKIRYIDTKGNYINNKTYDYGYDFSDGLALAYRDKKYVYIDKNGKEVITKTYKNCDPFIDGLAAFESNGKWGYMDKKGNVAIKPQFKEVKAFTNGYALVRLSNGKTAIIDKSGKNKTNGINLGIELNNYHYAQPIVGEGMFPVVDGYSGEYVFADINKPSDIKVHRGKYGSSWYGDFYKGFVDTNIFSEGLGSVKFYNDKWAVIDKNSKLITPAEYDYIGSFKNGYTVAGTYSKSYVIDKKGNKVATFPGNPFNNINYITGKLMCVLNNNGYQYYSFDGKQIKPKI